MSHYPVDEFDNPERGDHETWFHYHRRWWFKWAAEKAAQRRGIIGKDVRVLPTKKVRK